MAHNPLGRLALAALGRHGTRESGETPGPPVRPPKVTAAQSREDFNAGAAAIVQSARGEDRKTRMLAVIPTLYAIREELEDLAASELAVLPEMDGDLRTFTIETVGELNGAAARLREVETVLTKRVAKEAHRP